jgi:uncharacterized membrane protein YraQ (UPF0718 family)
MTFQLASTNLVAELAIIMVILLGWQFAAAEFAGAPLMVAIMAVLFRLFLTRRMVDDAKQQADRGIAGRMEGHAAMDMSATARFTAISHYFVAEWAAVWMDIGGGLLIAGALAAWVPATWWNRFFLTGHPRLAMWWGPLVGPVVAILSFVCSVGNVPLAAVLWNGGSSFGGVIAFIFADLIVIPVLNIYRKYYGLKMSALLLVTFFASMSLSALGIEFLFQALHLVPRQHHARVVEASISMNYTTVLNIIFLAAAVVLIWRFVTTGGVKMLRMMNRMPAAER